MSQPPSPAGLAVVTGAARRLGRAIALELGRRGYAIGLHYHASQEAAHTTAGELRQAGLRVELLPADLTDAAQIEGLFEQVDRLDQPLRVLVNSAAVMPQGDLRDLDIETWDATMALNLRAPWLCAQQAARRMAAGSVIINITESGAHKVWTRYPVYVLSKAGLEGLTRLLAKSLAPEIRVNAVAPGLVMRSEGLPEADWQRLVERLPLRQATAPEAVARAVSFIIENEAMTGETITIDGGYQLI